MRKILTYICMLASLLLVTPAVAAPHGGYHGGYHSGWHGGGGHWRNGFWIPGAIIGGAIATGVAVGCWRGWYDEFGYYHRVWVC